MLERISHVIVICILSATFLLGSDMSAKADVAMPSGYQVLPYSAISSPVLSDSIHVAKPIGLGSFTSDHTFTMSVSINRFDNPVDFYLGILAPAISEDLFLFNSSNALVTTTDGIVPWRTDVYNGLSVNLSGAIPLSALPSGDYTFFILAVPAGTGLANLFNNATLWMSSLGNLRELDVTQAAISLFGNDLTAATAVLMAHARGYELQEISQATLASSLSPYGFITSQTRTLARAANIQGLSTICQNPDDEELCQTEVNDRLAQLWQGNLEEKITTLILRAANLGYSASQIHAAVVDTLLVGGYFGGFVHEDCCDVENEKRIDPDGSIQICGRFESNPALPCPSGLEFDRSSPQNRRVDLFSDVELEPDGSDNGDGGGNDGDSSVPSTDGMIFPTYYKGTGTSTGTVSNSLGSIECSQPNLIVVAKVGGEGSDSQRIQLYTPNHSHWYSNQDYSGMVCRTPSSRWKILSEEPFDMDGTYYDLEERSGNTSSVSLLANLSFNSQRLWGMYFETIQTSGSGDSYQRDWTFDLEVATEAEYNAIVNP